MWSFREDPPIVASFCLLNPSCTLTIAGLGLGPNRAAEVLVDSGELYEDKRGAWIDKKRAVDLKRAQGLYLRSSHAASSCWSTACTHALARSAGRPRGMWRPALCTPGE